MTKKQLLYLWQYFLSGGGGTVASDLVMRPNFNDMANLSLTSPSNGSATFNGTSDYVAATTLNNYSTFSALSVSFWVYNNDFVNPKTQVANWGDNSNLNFGWLIFSGLFVDYKFSFLVSADGNTYKQLDGVATLTEKRWYYVTAVWESSTSMKIYIDGSLDASTTTSIPSSIYNTNYQTTIGADFDGTGETLTRIFAGNLANVAVWNRALTSDEINSIQWRRYDQLTAGESTGLVAWYALDDITGTSVPDSTGTYNATAY